MKIGTTSNLCSRYGDKNYARIKMLGYDTIDFQMANTNSELYAMKEEDFISCLKKERALIEALGLKVNQVHGPWPVPDGHEQAMASMKKSIRGTEALGSKYWIIHPMMPYGVLEKGTENEPKTWQYNVSVFKELVEEAKAHGVIICLENMPFVNFSISTPEEIMKLVKEINDDNFKICLDTGHVNMFKDVTNADAVRLFGKDLCALHCHDNPGNGDNHYMPYFGTIDWKDFYKALCEIGFDGVFSLECSPPSRLSDEMYDSMNEQLFAIATEIVSGK